jgi:hypothetical protein
VTGALGVSIGSRLTKPGRPSLSPQPLISVLGQPNAPAIREHAGTAAHSTRSGG